LSGQALQVAESALYSALMQGREKEVIDRIAFGGAKELEEVYAL
jgi:hypothetical protein